MSYILAFVASLIVDWAVVFGVVVSASVTSCWSFIYIYRNERTL